MEEIAYLKKMVKEIKDYPKDEWDKFVAKTDVLLSRIETLDHFDIRDFFFRVQKSSVGNPHFFAVIHPTVEQGEGKESITLRFSMKNLRKMYNELSIYFAERDLLLPRHIPEVII